MRLKSGTPGPNYFQCVIKIDNYVLSRSCSIIVWLFTISADTSAHFCFEQLSQTTAFLYSGRRPMITNSNLLFWNFLSNYCTDHVLKNLSNVNKSSDSDINTTEIDFRYNNYNSCFSHTLTYFTGWDIVNDYWYILGTYIIVLNSMCVFIWWWRTPDEMKLKTNLPFLCFSPRFFRVHHCILSQRPV